MSERIRVLVVDDSALMRKLIPAILARDSSIEVVGTAMDGAFALKKIEELKPDVVHTWLFAANCYGRAAAIACQTKVIIGGERSGGYEHESSSVAVPAGLSTLRSLMRAVRICVFTVPTGALRISAICS